MEHTLFAEQKWNAVTRREFLWLTSMTSAAFLVGCATNPVTGKTQLMLMSSEEEIQIDKQHSPHQFSADYGRLQDKSLNQYINQTGKKMAELTHRPQMPYSFQGVNATYVNAYAFPGGSVAVTRGILLALENEAELAALLGHELGHVNARHTAEQMSKGTLANVLVSGVSIVAGTQSAALGQIASQVGMVGAGALLASYSRDNERQADALGLEYMVKTGYSPDGFVGLMDMLRNLSKHKPSIIELMFSTHPMSDERYQTAVKAVQTEFGFAKKQPLYRDRYMDNTANLRAIKGAIEAMQKGETAMAQEKFDDAETHLKKALEQAPNDYAGLLMMSKCLLSQKKDEQAKAFVEKAKTAYPQEAQAYHVSGIVKLRQKNFEAAYQDFSLYEKFLPGNASILFFKGYSLEGMQQVKEAADAYYRYLQIVNQGEQAQYAYRRLVEWGYIKQK